MKLFLYTLATIFTTMLFSISLSNAQPIGTACNSQHSCGGCTIHFTQTSFEWYYMLDCGGEQYPSSGSGDYEGTFCGGQEPCSVPQEA